MEPIVPTQNRFINISSHQNSQIPDQDETAPPQPQNPTYFTGLPTTAPPSFHTVDLGSTPTPPSSHLLPHRNDETAATFIPHNQRPSPIPAPEPQTLLSVSESVIEDGGISIWAPSEPRLSEEERERDLEDRREDILVRLMDRMEAMERHFASTALIVSHLFSPSATHKWNGKGVRGEWLTDCLYRGSKR